MSELLTLADRCEAATGPDRELDALILTAAFGYRVEARQSGDEFFYNRIDRMGRILVPAFSASIDAAMTLVPETVNGRNTFPLIHKMTASLWRAHIGIPGPVEQGQNGNASTPALALVAALRARLNIQEKV